MGEYKVPQNVEAEDKILGPLSMKQFIYAMIGLAWGGLTFVILSKVIVVWIIVGIPPMLAALALGLYQKQDQSMETWIVAMAEYFTRPRIRVWHKEPVEQSFHLTPPPPKPEMPHKDPSQMRTQLQQLVNVVDSHGRSIQQPIMQNPDLQPVVDLTDRLGAGSLAQDSGVSVFSEPEQNDILDEKGEAAQSLDALMANTGASMREQVKAKMIASAAKPPTSPAKSISGSTAAPSGAILKLAKEGGDLTVAQIAIQARKRAQPLVEGQSVQLHNAEIL